MWLTVSRQPGSSDCITEPQAEAIDREWPAVLGIDNRRMVAIADGQNAEQLSVERNREFPPGLLWHDANCSFADIDPCHTVHIAPPLAGIKHQREPKALFRAD